MPSTSRIPFPVLWLYGPPGVGKTTVAWEIRARLGTAAAFVDIDQLGMCYPDHPDDPGRHRLKADALAAVLPGYVAAGARCVVVSGVADTASGVPADRLPDAVVTACRLRAEPAEVERRFTGRRGSDPGLVASVLREADELDRLDGLSVDTTGLTASEVADRVLATIGAWPGPCGEAAEPVVPVDPPVDERILWLCGAVGVGKSSAGFPVYLKALAAGVTAGYVDLDQIGFGPGDAHRLKAHNLAALWRVFRAAGARRLVVVGRVDDDAGLKTYTGLLPEGTVTLVRLHAGPAALAERIASRGAGGGWPQPGDPLFGKPEGYLREAAGRAAEEAGALDAAGVGDFRVETDGRTADEVAEAVAACAGWPG